MKYRIEDGEVKMPISELNRINDKAELLEKAIIKYEDEKSKYDSGLVKKTFFSFDTMCDAMWSGSEESIRKLEDLSGQIIEKKAELNNLKKIVDGMSILQFIRFRKNLSGSEKP